MSKTIAEVLRGHWSRSTHTDSESSVDKCDGCGEVLYTWGELANPCERLAAHQAAALSAAGFGLVTDAKAEAHEELGRPVNINAEALEAAKRVNDEALLYLTMHTRLAVALEAAAPFIRAEALEEAADHLDQPRILWWGDRGATVADSPDNPRVFTKLTEWLRGRSRAEVGIS